MIIVNVSISELLNMRSMHMMDDAKLLHSLVKEYPDLKGFYGTMFTDEILKFTWRPSRRKLMDQILHGGLIGTVTSCDNRRGKLAWTLPCILARQWHMQGLQAVSRISYGSHHHSSGTKPCPLCMWRKWHGGGKWWGLGHSNMIHCFPFHQKVWGMQVGSSLFTIHCHCMY